MPEFKLVGGRHEGRIVAIENPFLIEQQIIPRVDYSERGGIVYDIYTRREWDGIFFYVAQDISDQVGKLLRGVAA